MEATFIIENSRIIYSSPITSDEEQQNAICMAQQRKVMNPESSIIVTVLFEDGSIGHHIA